MTQKRAGSSPGGPASSAGNEILDHLRTLEAQGSPGVLAQVVEIFLLDNTVRLSALRDAIARRDGEATYRVAHTMQGSAAMVGARSVAERCAELALAARSEAFDRCEALAGELEAGIQAIQRVVVG